MSSKHNMVQKEEWAWYRPMKPRGRESYHNGKLEGEHKLWWRNGQIRTKIIYRNGVRDGECKWWNADGELARHKFYRNGRTVDTHFTSKKWTILRVKRRLRNCDTHWFENMLICDLVKIV